MLNHPPFGFLYGDGRLGCVRTGEGASINGNDGKQMLQGILRITRIEDEQPDPGARPVRMATLEYTPSDSTLKPYTVKKPYDRLLGEFNEVASEVLPPGIPFDNRQDRLLIAVLSLADDVKRCRVPEHATPYWVESSGKDAGVYYQGEKVSEVVEVIGKPIDPASGATHYRLRRPRTSPEGGYDYAEATLDELSSGNIRFAADAFKVRHPIKAYMALTARYEGATDGERRRWVEDEKAQLRREYEKKIEGMFLINGKRPDGSVPFGGVPR